MSNYQAHSIPPPYDAERRMYSSPGVSYYGEQEKGGACVTMGRIPYLTILGVLLIGGGCAFVMLGYKTFAPNLYDTYEAMGYNTTLASEWCKDCAKEIQKEADKGKDSYYSPENPNYIISDATLAGVGVLFLLILAILGTGYTREICCQARPCCQCYAMFVNFVTGLVVLLLLVIFLASGIVMLVPLAGTYYLDDKCADSTASPKRPCFDLAIFGMEVSTGAANTTNVCFGDENICDRLEDMQRGFIYWTAGSFGAFFGFMFSLMALAANFAHFRDMKKVENEEKYVF